MSRTHDANWNNTRPGDEELYYSMTGYDPRNEVISDSVTRPASPSYYARHGFDDTFNRRQLRSSGPAAEIGLPRFPPNWRNRPDAISEASSAASADEPQGIFGSRSFFMHHRVRHTVIG